jgi:hypothetical protein
MKPYTVTTGHRNPVGTTAENKGTNYSFMENRTPTCGTLRAMVGS